MSEPVVIGLDSSTQGTKAVAWDPAGRAVAEGRAATALANPQLGFFEQDPEDWWAAACTALRGCVEGLAAGRIAGLAISNQRETIAFLDADGRSVYPAMVWLDERARVEVRDLAEQLGAERIHRITGRHPDLTPCLYRILWMARNRPEAFAATACFADVQATLVSRLCGGPPRTGWISADPMGLVDLEARTWSAPILEALGIGPERLPAIHPPGTELGRITSEAAASTGLPVGLPVFAAGGDGQLAGLGTACVTPDRAYVNLGTAVVSGVWSPTYLYDRAWRTELAAQGEGYILETCLRSGAFLVNWFVHQFVPGGREDASILDRLEAEALALPIGAEGLLVQPYWSGVMDPHWDIDARGVILGLSGSHRPAHVYRAILEGITLDQVMRSRMQEAALGAPFDHYVAIGGGARSRLWREMLADASGKPVHVSDTVEASSLGAAMIAAAGVGWYGSIVDASTAMAGRTRAVEPNAARGARYAALLDIYEDVYGATARLNNALVAFAHEAASGEHT